MQRYYGRPCLACLQVRQTPLQVSIAGPAETIVRRGPLEHGVYSFAYSTKTPGTYSITATAAGVHMEGSPATVTASIAEAFAPLCEVVGTPLRISTIAGEPHGRALSRRCSGASIYRIAAYTASDLPYQHVPWPSVLDVPRRNSTCALEARRERQVCAAARMPLRFRLLGPCLACMGFVSLKLRRRGG